MTRSAMIAVAALTLASCGPNQSPPAPAPFGTKETVVLSNSYNDIAKVCDEGRAIYYVRDANSAALAIFPDAKECVR